MHIPILILGPRKCGKSESVEQELLGWRNRLYVGTLWHDIKFYHALRKHRIRRDTLWHLVECTGQLSDDTNKIYSVLAKMERPAACMIDGLTTWAIHCSLGLGDVLQCARELTLEISHLIERQSDVSWRLIDVIPEAFSSADQLIYRYACELIYNRIIIEIPHIRIVHYQECCDAKL